jgi:hypothetical protein
MVLNLVSKEGAEWQLFLTVNLHTAEAKWAGTFLWSRNQYPDSIFQAHFASPFPADAQRCQCGNVHLQFVLVEQIPNIQHSESVLFNPPTKTISLLFTVSKLVLPFLSAEIMGSSTGMTAAWFLACIHKLMSPQL